MSDSYQHLFQNSFRTKPFFLWPKLSNLLPGLLTTPPSPAPRPSTPRRRHPTSVFLFLRVPPTIFSPPSEE